MGRRPKILMAGEARGEADDADTGLLTYVDGEAVDVTDDEDADMTEPTARDPSFELPPGYMAMDSAPTDGTLVSVIAPGGREALARLRRTRRRDPAARRWVEVQFWADALTAVELLWDPVGWKMPEGFNVPGMVRA